MRISNTILNKSGFVLGGIIILLASFWYGFNNGLMPKEASVEAGLVDTLFNSMMVVATVIFLGVQGMLVYSMIRFRHRGEGDDGDGVPLHGDPGLEILWTAIPTVLVLWLSIYSFNVSQRIVGSDPSIHHNNQNYIENEPAVALALPGSKPVGTPLVVKVKAQQYGWSYIYPGAKEEVGELHMPIGQEVVLRMQAMDVIHGFWVPEFRLKQDVIPGQTTEVRFTPIRAGEYTINCTQLCGAYHGVMRSLAVVQEPKAYQAWIKENVK